MQGQWGVLKPGLERLGLANVRDVVSLPLDLKGGGNELDTGVLSAYFQLLNDGKTLW